MAKISKYCEECGIILVHEEETICPLCGSKLREI